MSMFTILQLLLLIQPQISKKGRFFKTYKFAKNPLQQNQRNSWGTDKRGKLKRQVAQVNRCANLNCQYFGTATNRTNIHQNSQYTPLFSLINEMSVYYINKLEGEISWSFFQPTIFSVGSQRFALANRAPSSTRWRNQSQVSSCCVSYIQQFFLQKEEGPCF